MSDHYSNTSPDRRIHRTRQTIIEAFLTLIMEKDFSSIIIKDITEAANINRSTFYSHYRDKYDLLEIITDENSLLLRNLINNESLHYDNYQPSFDSPDPYFIVLFEHIAANELFYKVMFTKVPSVSFPDKILEVIRDSCYTRISKIGLENKMIVPLDLLLDYFSSSLLGIVRKWLDQQMIYSPRYMALQLTRLSLYGLYNAIGVTNSPLNHLNDSTAT